jgi:hypothetical protein
VPKDADVLVSIDADINLDPLARLGRRLQGTAQTINLAADIFLADAAGHYLGRICHYRECHPRVACRALSCGRRQHLNDNLSAHRPVATYRCTLCRADGYACASGREAGRCRARELNPSRAASRLASAAASAPRCTAEIQSRSARA